MQVSHYQKIPIIMLCFLFSLYFSYAQEINKQTVEFNPFTWSETRLVQVYFAENPTKEKAFFLTAPTGWVTVQDITRAFNPDVVKKMNTDQILSRYQSVYPLVVIAKALDALAWQLDPYNFFTPVKELQLYVQDFLLEQYAQYKKLDRSSLDDATVYKLLREEVADQEFSLNVVWPWCDNARLKKSCAQLQSRRMLFKMTDVSLNFMNMPNTLEDFAQEIIPQLQQWHASNRRLFVFQTLLSTVEKNELQKKSPSTIIKLGQKEPPKKDVSPAFFTILWDKVPVFTYADFCDFPTLICNKFDRKKFEIPLSNDNIQVMLSLKLQDN